MRYILAVMVLIGGLVSTSHAANLLVDPATDVVVWDVEATTGNATIVVYSSNVLQLCGQGGGPNLFYIYRDHEQNGKQFYGSNALQALIAYVVKGNNKFRIHTDNNPVWQCTGNNKIIVDEVKPQ